MALPKRPGDSRATTAKVITITKTMASTPAVITGSDFSARLGSVRASRARRSDKRIKMVPPQAWIQAKEREVAPLPDLMVTDAAADLKPASPGGTDERSVFSSTRGRGEV
ncbi:hypothetical protein GCM10009562_40470 [Nocardioides aquaticus]